MGGREEYCVLSKTSNFLLECSVATGHWEGCCEIVCPITGWDSRRILFTILPDNKLRVEQDDNGGDRADWDEDVIVKVYFEFHMNTKKVWRNTMWVSSERK
jgi:hypothetical protein